MRYISYALLALSLSKAACAHDFWIQPSAFHVSTGDKVSVRFLIGEPAAAEHWETEWRKVVTLQDWHSGGATDLLGNVSPLNGAKVDLGHVDASLLLETPGTHMIAFTSNQQVNDLPPEEFTTYAEHEGLTLPLADRKQKGTVAARGRELYSRRAKALIQVGTHPTDTVSKRIGQTLEIVPDSNPYQLKSGAPLIVHVWFHGAPLEGASVVLERLDSDARPGAPMISDRQGRVRFEAPHSGSWKINTVWSYPITDPRAEYETIFCSLTFGS